jgi:hypothetical protein
MGRSDRRRVSARDRPPTRSATAGSHRPPPRGNQYGASRTSRRGNVGSQVIEPATHSQPRLVNAIMRDRAKFVKLCSACNRDSALKRDGRPTAIPWVHRTRILWRSLPRPPRGPLERVASGWCRTACCFSSKCRLRRRRERGGKYSALTRPISVSVDGTALSACDASRP